MALPKVNNNGNKGALGKLTQAVLVNPAKETGKIVLSSVMNEAPELGMLTGLLGSVSDAGKTIGNLISGDKNKTQTQSKTPAPKKAASPSKGKTQTAPKSQAANTNAAQSASFSAALSSQANILQALLQTSLESTNELKGIHVELRTLSSITAKVWDVSKKQLSDTRAWQKKVLERNRKDQFSGTIASTDNESLKENLAKFSKVNAFGQSLFGDKDKSKEKGFLDKVGDVFTNSLDEMLGILGIGKVAKGLKASAAAPGIAKTASKFSKVASPLAGTATAGGMTRVLAGAGNIAGKTGLVAAGVGGVMGGVDSAMSISSKQWDDAGKKVKDSWEKGNGFTAAWEVITSDITKKIAGGIANGAYDGVQGLISGIIRFVSSKELADKFDSIADGIQKVTNKAIGSLGTEESIANVNPKNLLKPSNWYNNSITSQEDAIKKMDSQLLQYYKPKDEKEKVILEKEKQIRGLNSQIDVAKSSPSGTGNNIVNAPSNATTNNVVVVNNPSPVEWKTSPYIGK